MKIQMNNITKTYGGDLVIDACNFEVVLGSHAAILGDNGSGKSTLLKIIAGIETYDAGQRIVPKGIRIAYMKQQFEDYPKTAKNYIMSAFPELESLQQVLHTLWKECETSNYDATIMARYLKKQESFTLSGGYDIENTIDMIAKGLGVFEMLERPYMSLSGGEKTRVELVRMLALDCDVLCLDEPTNHLDLEGIEWLEKYCRGLRKTCIIVSHDREFLDRIVSVYHHLDMGQVKTYKGNYASYIEQKESAFQTLLKDYDKQQKEIARLRKMIARYREWGLNGDNEDFFKKAKSIEKRIERMTLIEKPRDTVAMESLILDVKGRSGKRVLEFECVDIGYDKPLLSNINKEILWRDRLVIMGPNGSGKTSLIESILDSKTLLSGNVSVSESARIAYLPQTPEVVHNSVRLEAYVREKLAWSEFETRRLLARFQFDAQDCYKAVSKLSGGERVRVALAILMAKGSNFLILDEPTNHLDLKSIEILESVLQEYKGTLLIVSHDRYFVKKLNLKPWIIK